MKNKLIKLMSLVALATSVNLNSKVVEFSGKIGNRPLITEEARVAQIREQARLRNVFDQLFNIASLIGNITPEGMQIFGHLLAQGVTAAQLNSNVNVNRDTLLFVAIQRGHAEIVRGLLSVGANPNLPRALDGATPLIVATQMRQLSIIKVLVDAEVDLNQARLSDGLTPLFVASQLGYSDIVMFLNMKGISNESAVANNGMTPLMIAAISGHTETVHCLLLANADLFFKLNYTNHVFNGLNAYEMAQRRGLTTVVEIMNRYLIFNRRIQAYMTNNVYTAHAESCAKRPNNSDDINPRPSKR